MPIGGLPPGDGRQRCAHRRACRRIDRRPPSPGPRQVAQPPGDRDKEADLRQVGVAVGAGLSAHLHQPDDGHQHADVPQPADQQVSFSQAEPDRGQRDRHEHRQRQQRVFQAKARTLVDVLHDHSRRPEHLPDEGRVGNHGVGQPKGKIQRLELPTLACRHVVRKHEPTDRASNGIFSRITPAGGSGSKETMRRKGQ